MAKNIHIKILIISCVNEVHAGFTFSGIQQALIRAIGFKNELSLRQKKRWSIDLSIVLFPKGVEMLKFTIVTKCSKNRGN